MFLTGRFYFVYAPGQKKTAASSPKTAAAAGKRSVRQPAEPVQEEAADEVPQDDDNGNAAVTGGGDDGNVLAATAASGKEMLRTAGKQASGLAGTAAESGQLAGSILESFNGLLRENIQNVRHMVDFKKSMLSWLSGALTNGAIDLMRNAQEIGAEGGRVASGLLRNTANTAKTVVQTGGVLANAPIQMTNDGLRVVKRVASIPPKATNFISNVAGGVFSMAGIHSEERNAERGQVGETEDIEIVAPPKQKAVPKKGGGTKK